MDDLMTPGLFAIFCGIMIFSVVGNIESKDEPVRYQTHMAPDVTQSAIGDAALLTDADLRAGEVTIVNFWASWCGPCRREHKVLMHLQDEGYRVAGVSMRDDENDAVNYLTKYGDPYFATGLDRSGAVARRWGSSATPVTYIVAGDGTVVHRHYGAISWSRLEETFMPALVAAEAYGNWDDDSLLEAIVAGE